MSLVLDQEPQMRPSWTVWPASSSTRVPVFLTLLLFYAALRTHVFRQERH